MGAKHRVTINLAEEEYQELVGLSERSRVSLAWLGRQAIIDFLDRYAGDDRQLPLDLASGKRRAND